MPCPSHPPWLDRPNVFDEKCRLWRSPLCNLFHPPVTSSKCCSQRHDVPSRDISDRQQQKLSFFVPEFSTPETCPCCVLEGGDVRSGVVLRQHKRGRAVGPPSAQCTPWHFARRSSCCCCCWRRRTGLRRPSGRDTETRTGSHFKRRPKWNIAYTAKLYVPYALILQEPCILPTQCIYHVSYESCNIQRLFLQY
jgi:hypothetical protein